ncbi:hypothetical protein F1649_19505 [Arcticibacter tournemirensis]|uniref:Uncharacterized protein n=1 Tax=Arcticibacter tournemirensis TaxID=699437 RepID=A0A5M9GQ33_9SPHI|nr:hypothetical protein [Arcticibacter tournemirensis]KAA8476863.1 hypothetical protein F1649_19505 [Arcticibacter tournemirensis]
MRLSTAPVSGCLCGSVPGKVKHQQLKAHWQAKARIVGYDAGSPELINRQKRIAPGSLPVAGSNQAISFCHPNIP